MSRLALAALLNLLLITPSGQAVPLIEALYLQGEFLDGADLLPGFDGGSVFNPGDVVRSNGQRDLVANPNGSFVTPVNTGDFGNNGAAAGVFYLFGTTNTGGANPLAIRREATIGGAEQIVFGAKAGIDYEGVVSYSASIPNPTPGGSARLSTLWEDNTLVFTEGDVIPAGPLAGSFISGPGGLYRSPAGVTSFVSTFSSTAGGPNAGTALFSGTTTYDVLLQSGDDIPGIGPIAIDDESATISSNIIWSQLGSKYITSVSFPDGGVDNFGNPTYGGAMVVNGVALTTGSGAVLKADLPIPTADGGLEGETFDSFQGFDVNEAGDWVVGAFTDGVPTDQDDVLLHNGQVVYRAGQTVDGVLLSGQLQGATINDRGDIAFAWNDTLFINGQAIAGIGTPVDTDGDGQTDTTIGGSGLSLNRMEITNQIAAGGDGLPVVYIAGEIASTQDTTFRLAPATSIDGDYNYDSLVDAADYTVWRDTLGSQLLLSADGDGDNVVDEDDYTVWANAVLGAPSAVVPEPSTLVGLVLLAIGVGHRRR